MAIKTTMNLDAETARRLDEQAKKANLTRSEMVVLLANACMKKFKKFEKIFRVVQYQRRGNDENWKTVHITLSEKDYSYCVDMRNFYKSSFSRLIALAIKEHLYDEEKTNKLLFLRTYKDNNYFYGYGLMSKKVESSVLWLTFWNIPQNNHSIPKF